MSEGFDQLVSVMTRLRAEGGCSWDKEQTHDSLKPYLIEEAYEVLEAIESGRAEPLQEELGDLLFQVLFHAQIAKENNSFDIESVLKTTVEKMTHRHPHVFSKENGAGDGVSEDVVLDSKTVLARWEALKKKEPRNKDRKSALDGVPSTLPALLRAQQIQSRAACVGFDWKDIKPVLEKIEEEKKELQEAVDEGGQDRIESELGDLLFSIVNYARFLKVNTEDALRGATGRFIKRFHWMEKDLKTTGQAFEALSLDEMNDLWEKAKLKLT